MADPTSYPLGTIAKLLDLSNRRVQQLSKEGIIPKTERGRYELVPAVRGYIRYLKERSINPGVVSFDEVRARKTAAEAEMAELELLQRKGDLIPMQQVVDTWLELIASCRSKMLSMPAKLAPVVAVEDNPAVCKQIVEEQMMEALDEIARWIDDYADDAGSDEIADGDNGEGMETTADTDGEPMG